MFLRHDNLNGTRSAGIEYKYFGAYHFCMIEGRCALRDVKVLTSWKDAFLLNIFLTNVSVHVLNGKCLGVCCWCS